MKELILTALCELYERLLANPDSDVAKPGYSESSADAAFEIALDGQLLRIVPLGTQKGKSVVGLKLKVPERVIRSSGDAPNFLCDNIEYVIGVRPAASEPDDRSTKRKELFNHLHMLLDPVDDDGARAMLAFLSRSTADLLADPRIADVRQILDRGGNIVFRLQGDDRFIHDRLAVMRAWERYRAQRDPGGSQGQCLVTGEYGPIARLHKNTSGVAGAQPTGASLVSFNFRATESYRKRDGQNSPVSERAVFRYGTALNWLTSHKGHRVLAGDTTVVFWAERPGPEENLLLQAFATAFGTQDEDTEEKFRAASSTNDEASIGRITGTLERMFRGQMPVEGGVVFDETTRFYILGLAPNAARLSVRFWNVNTFGGVLQNLRQHYEDMAIVNRDAERPVSVPRLLLELAPAASQKRENVPKILVGSLMRSILEGTAYPQSLYASLISRIRVDSNDPDKPRLERKINYPRAAYLKAHLKRKARISKGQTQEEELTEVLNTKNKNPGYLMGRLFAFLEKAQQDANPGINATIKDRYYASASSTPSSVFPVLLKLTQHHLSKSEYGNYVDKQIEGVMAEIERFPAHLNLDQQGMFALGYYQQKAALYVKSDHGQKGGETHDESR